MFPVFPNPTLEDCVPRTRLELKILLRHTPFKFNIQGFRFRMTQGLGDMGTAGRAGVQANEALKPKALQKEKAHKPKPLKD